MRRDVASAGHAAGPTGDCMIDDLLKRRALIVMGKGGVGRTSVSAALALLRAADSGRVLAIEYDRAGALAATLGRKPSLVAAEAAPGVWTAVLDGAFQLEEYLATVVPSRAMLKAIVHSGIYRYFVEAAPGLRDLIMVGKIYHELEYRPPAEPWDLVVLDAPATGQALNVLRMPLAAHETFGGAIVGRTAERVAELLRDPARCAVVLVTSPEAFAVSETLEAYAEIASMGLHVGAIVMNRMRAPGFDARGVGRLERAMAQRAGAGAAHFERLAALARNQLARARAQRRALELVRRRLGAPVIAIGECEGLGAMALARALAGEFARQRRGATRVGAVRA